MNSGLVVDGVARCWWCGDDALYQQYHDEEWGFPVTDDRRLFEKLCLEGFQAGLSWITILRKRERFREVFDNFDIERVAGYGPRKIETLLNDAGIIRHRGKIEATINNAQRAIELIEAEGSLAGFIWRYEPGADERPGRLTRTALAEMATCPSAKRLSRDLQKRGWRFLGPTTAYAFMQAMGLVNDHLEGCHARPQVAAARSVFQRPT